MIPEYVVAYAAGLLTASESDEPVLAEFIERVGLGQYDQVELVAAAHAWVAKHVAPEVREGIRRFKAREQQTP